MFLGNLIKPVKKEYRKISVEGICFDSKKIKKKDIFFAIEGNQTSGVKFIEEAIYKGASVIVSNKKVKIKNRQTPLLLVKDVRKSLSEACSNFYKKKPSNIIAVTGTNGKSSVADFFYQILNLNFSTRVNSSDPWKSSMRSLRVKLKRVIPHQVSGWA